MALLLYHSSSKDVSDLGVFSHSNIPLHENASDQGPISITGADFIIVYVYASFGIQTFIINLANYTFASCTTLSLLLPDPPEKNEYNTQ